MAAERKVPIWRTLASGALEYRVPVNATIILMAFASIFILSSQSASSWPTYVVGVYVLVGVAKWRSLFFDGGFLLVVALLVYIPLTSLWSTPWDARDALSQVTRALLVFAFVVSIAECVQVDWFRRRLAQTLAAFGGVAAAAAMVRFVIEPPDDGRLNGLGQLDTHVTAAMMYAVAGVCGLAWFATSGRRSAARWFAGACVPAAVAAVVLTGSRNALVCLTFGIGCLRFADRVPNAARFLSVAGVFALVVLAGLFAAYWLLPGADDVVLPRGDSFRPAIWSEYLARIRSDGMWFGRGVSTPDSTWIDGNDVLHPHNLYLAVALQGGGVGLALMLGVVTATTATLLRNFQAPAAKLALAIWAMALPCYLLDGHALIDKIGWTWLLFWLPVAIAVGVRARLGLEDACRFGVRLG